MWRCCRNARFQNDRRDNDISAGRVLDHAGKALAAATVVGSRVDDKSRGHTQRPSGNRCFVSTTACFIAVRALSRMSSFSRDNDSNDAAHWPRVTGSPGRRIDSTIAAHYYYCYSTRLFFHSEGVIAQSPAAWKTAIPSRARWWFWGGTFPRVGRKNNLRAIFLERRRGTHSKTRVAPNAATTRRRTSLSIYIRFFRVTSVARTSCTCVSFFDHNSSPTTPQWRIYGRFLHPPPKAKQN